MPTVGHVLTALLSPIPPAAPIPVATDDFPVWARIVIAMAFVLIGLLVAGAKWLPERTSTPPPPVPAAPAAAAAEPPQSLTQRVEQGSDFIERVLAGLERRLDLALAETAQLREDNDREIAELRDERDEYRRQLWEKHSRLTEVTRELEGSRAEVVRLRARLDAQAGYQGRSNW